MPLRVLQEREFERLGGGDSVRVDVRVVAATNRDLGEEVRVGRVRDDLYYRLNVFPIRILPLRERLEDIGSLAARLAAKHASRLNRTVERIDKASLKLLESYDWPGNVRELASICATRSATRSSPPSASLTAVFRGLTAQPSDWDFQLLHSSSESNGSVSTNSRSVECRRRAKRSWLFVLQGQ
jgi:transcriptional regulator with GAF, ATPase, and Fis domain